MYTTSATHKHHIYNAQHVGTPQVHQMFTTCTLHALHPHVPSMYTTMTPHIYHIYTTCSSHCTSLVRNMYTKCIPHKHHISCPCTTQLHLICPSCTPHVHLIYTSCTTHEHIMYTSCHLIYNKCTPYIIHPMYTTCTHYVCLMYTSSTTNVHIHPCTSNFINHIIEILKRKKINDLKKIDQNLMKHSRNNKKYCIQCWSISINSLLK